MARTPDIQNVVDVIEEVTYKPLPRERELKVRYWLAINDDPFASSDLSQTRQSAERLAGGKLTAWNQPGFQEWFFNKAEYKQKLEYLAVLALGAMEDILVNTDPKVQGARVQMIKAVMDLSGKSTPKQTNIQVNTQIGQQIAGMNQAQLEAYIKKSLPSESSNIIEANPLLVDKAE